ncbi:hypothetical protein RchiOBHm_Chr3g0488641 [Rosa chinensis]|uniref:Uncharacterized protein n=1 Tax=Rosa chinensis TaxID=74649 RepID=A0A2P6RFV9_ROSCH|nr:hypothetical protein RchiOBHm_Chr3g0488641 [Rosa chinensis]
MVERKPQILAPAAKVVCHLLLAFNLNGLCDDKSLWIVLFGLLDLVAKVKRSDPVEG